MQKVFLICGVSGSGKSWVCRQVQDKFRYIEHDLYYENHVEVVTAVAKTSDRPIITECPFAERVLKNELEANGLTVVPIFVIEDPDLVRLRYEEREKKPLPKAAYSRAHTIRARAQEWQALHGKSQEILEILKGMSL